MPKAQVGSVRLDYELRGQGPPLLMINGFRRSRVVWLEPFLAPLARHFTLVLFDNRGTGHSDKPEDGYSIEAFADDCAGLLAALDIERAHVFGVSMGGMIAQRVATRHPQRVQRLGLGCTHCGTRGVMVPPERRIWDLLRLMPDETLDAREIARRQEEAYVTDAFRAANRTLLDRLFEIVNANPPPPHVVQGHRQAIERFDGCGELDAIRSPTLVITGSEDRLIVPENSRLIARRIAGAELVLLPEAAHLFWIERPEASAEALIRFFGGPA